MPQTLCKGCGQWVSGGTPQMQKHLQSERHQSITAFNNKRKKEEEFSIFVAGYPNPEKMTENILKDLFIQFGTIESCFLAANKRFAFIQFDTKKACTTALNIPVVYENTTLSVRPKLSKQQASPSGAPTIANNIEIEPIGSWENQVRQLMIALGMSFTPLPPEYDDRINTVCQSIKDALSKTFTPCQTSVFGSRRTGLAKLNSDVDVYVDLSNSEYIQAADPEARDLAEFQQCVFQLCAKSFYRSPLFINILSVGKARCPVIKCVHKSTGIQCDITFKNAHSLWNSCLIKYYLKLDERIKFMVVTLRQWVRTLNGDYLSPYSLCMMLFTYLCRLPKPLLPCVKDLMSLNQSPVYAAGWQCSFIEMTFKTENEEGIRELLEGFFSFLSTFDFGVDVMCVNDATIVPKWKFLSADTLPDTQASLKNAMLQRQLEFPVRYCVCLQDPLELSHNTTRGITLRHLKEFRQMCIAASKYCANNPASLNGLFNLNEALSRYSGQPDEVQIDFYNFYPPIEQLQAGVDIRDIWHNRVLAIIKDVFHFIFHFESRNDLDPSLFKPAKLNDKSITLKFDSKYRLWDQRKKLAGKMTLPSNIHMFEKEMKISQRIINNHYQKEDSKKYCITIEVEICYKTSPTEFVIKIINTKFKLLAENEKPSNEDRENDTTGLIVYLKSNLQHLVDKCLSEDYKTFIEDAEEVEEKMEGDATIPQPSSSSQGEVETHFEAITEGLSTFKVKSESTETSEKKKHCKQEDPICSVKPVSNFPPPGYILHETFTYLPKGRRADEQNDEVVIITPVKEEKVIPVVDLEDNTPVNKSLKYGSKLGRKRTNETPDESSSNEAYSPQTVLLSALSKTSKKKRKKKKNQDTLKAALEISE